MIINLEDNASIPLAIDDISVYEELDLIIHRYLLKAKKKYRKLYMGGLCFLTELVIHLNLIKCWCLLIRKKRGGCTNISIIQLQKLCGIIGCLLGSKLASMYQQYKQIIVYYHGIGPT